MRIAHGLVAASIAWLQVVVAEANESRRDPGILLELDREAFRIDVVDLASGDRASAIRVAVGSPAHPTPAGEYRLYSVIRDPDWEPGDTARRFGAEPIAASAEGPLGIAKIPFSGEFALHGGGNPYTVAKPVTLGCLRATNEALASLLDWLEARRALGRVGHNDDGERPQPFVRPARIVIR